MTDPTVAHLLLPALAIVTLPVYLWCGERVRNLRVQWILKPATSALYLATAALQGPEHVYDWLMVAGLVLCAVGDTALIHRERTWFLTGLVAFLLGHVAYVIAFNTRASLASLHPVPLAAVAAVSVGLFLYFRPYLGRMFWPVVAYVVVITLMLMSALAVATGGDPGIGPGLLVPLGALLFYVSDITVARDRFVPGVGFANRVYGLPLYYAAQFLFAFSVGR